MIDQFTANSAKRGVKTVRFITMRTNRFKPHPAAVAKDRISQILALTLRANHDGGQFLLGCIGPQFRRVEPKSEQRREQAVYIVPGYAKATYSIVTKLMFAALGELHRPSRRVGSELEKHPANKNDPVRKAIAVAWLFHLVGNTPAITYGIAIHC